jgi:hypothetical protein
MDKGLTINQYGGGMRKQPQGQKKIMINDALEQVKNNPMNAQAVAMELMKRGIKKI